jgi:hypothetical protein
MVYSQGRKPLDPSHPRPPSPGRGGSDHRRQSVPAVALFVRDPMPLQERDELLLEGNPPMMLSLPGQIRSLYQGLAPPGYGPPPLRGSG